MCGEHISELQDMINLAQFGSTPLDYATLVDLLKDYKSPKDKIASMVQQGQLARIKKGLLVVSPQEKDQFVLRELVANHLYGPSYVSLESALSFHQLIPERVYSVCSVTMKRAKSYTTPLGVFDYRSVSEAYFPIGIQQHFTNAKSTFLIASPEKALCDMIVLSSGLRLQSPKAVQEYVESDLRVDLTEYKNWNIEILRECAKVGIKKTALFHLITILKDHE